MKLTELEPRWLGLNGWASPDRAFHIGATFLCPCCRSRRLFVVFEQAVDPTGIAADPVCGFDWPPRATEGAYAPDRLCRREGDSFDSMTLTPPRGLLELAGHQMFTVRDGEVTLCG